MIRIPVLCLFAVLLIASDLVAEGQPVRLAVIPGVGARAPKAGVVEWLTAELTKQKDLIVLEREEVAKIVAEHQLGADLTAHGVSLRLGQLTGVEVFMVVEALPGSSRISIRWLDAKTGIALRDTVDEGAPGKQDVEALMRETRLALKKAGVPPEARRYLGILGFRSQDVDRSADAVTAAMATMVAVDLNASPSLILLDREHLKRIQEEKDLTGSDLKLASSATLLDGTIQSVPGQSNYVVNIALRAPGRAAPNALRLETTQVPADVRRAVVKAVLEALRAEPAPSGAVARETEAALFAKRAKALASHGEDPLPAAYAAYVLHPTQQNLLTLAQFLSGVERLRWTHRLLWNEVELLKRQGKTVRVPPLFGTPLGNDVPLAGPLGGEMIGSKLSQTDVALLISGILQTKDSPREWIPMEQEIVRLRLATLTGVQGFDWYACLESLYSATFTWARTPEEWGGYLREILSTYLDRPESVRQCGPHYAWRFLLFGLVPQQLALWNPYLNCNPNIVHDMSKLEPTFEWMRRQNDDCVALLGYVMPTLHSFRLGAKTDEDVAAVTKALDFYLKTFPLSHEGRQTGRLEPYLMDAMSPCMSALGPRRELKRHYLVAILEPLVQARDAQRLSQWMDYHSGMAWGRQAMESCMTKDERLAWMTRVHGILVGPVTSEYRGYYGQAAAGDVIDELCREIAKLGGRSPDTTGAWQEYGISVQALELKPDSIGKRGTLAAVRGMRDGALMLVRCEAGENRTGVRAVRVEARTGMCRDVGSSEVIGTASVTDVAVEKDRVWVATTAGLVQLGDRSRVWTKTEGLPSDHVRCVDAADGTVYLGFEGALYRFVPAKNEFTELASSRSVLHRGPLDGGEAYAIDDVLFDAARNRLWVAAGERGVWVLDPRTGAAERKLGTMGGVTIKWDGDDVLACRGGELRLYDPTTLRAVGLLGGSASVFGDPTVGFSSWVRLGPCLLTGIAKGLRVAAATSDGSSIERAGKAGLYLHTRRAGRPDALLESPRGANLAVLDLVRLNSEEAVAATLDGRLLRIARNPEAAGHADVAYALTDADALRQRIGSNAIPVRSATSSSDAPPGPSGARTAASLIDRDPQTAWAAATNNVAGAWVEFVLGQKSTVSEILVVNGCSSPDGPSSYAKFHRAGSVTWSGDAGQQHTSILCDLSAPQVVRLPKAMATGTLRLRINDVYPADVALQSDPPRVAISEIAFFAKESKP